MSFLANPKYTHHLYQSQASAVIVSNDFVPEHPVQAALIRVENPYVSFANLLKIYNEMQLNKEGISEHAVIEPSAKIGQKCYVAPFVYIGENVTIGDNVKLYPHVYVGDNCTIASNTTLFSGAKVYCNNIIGANCIIHSGAVIGADGFGFAPTEDGAYSKIDQIGTVIIEDNVEIGANTCVDRATMGTTTIHRGVKLDNLCQIAHNVSVGEHTVMAAQSAIAGSGKVGSHCVVAGQVGIVGHITVGDNVVIAAQSGVTRDISSNCTILGSPAMEAHQQRKNYVYMRNIEKLVKRVDELEKRLAELSK